MSKLSTKLTSAVIGLGILLVLPACNTATTSSTGVSDGQMLLIPAAEINQLKPGLTAHQIIDLLGKPEMVKPIEAKGIQSEVWIYRVSWRETTTQVPTTEVDQPSINPLTGQPMTVKVPVYQNRTSRVYQTLELLMIDGKLEQRKPGRPEVETSYI